MTLPEQSDSRAEFERELRSHPDRGFEEPLTEQTNRLEIADAAILEVAATEVDQWTDVLARYGIDLQDVGLAVTDARALAQRIREESSS